MPCVMSVALRGYASEGFYAGAPNLGGDAPTVGIQT